MTVERTPKERQLQWDRVNDTVQRCAERLVSARISADYSGIGHSCRDGLSALAQAIYDPDRHPATDDKTVSSADAKRMFDAYFAAEFSGTSHTNEAVRKLAKASFDLANAVQHRVNASFDDAALAMEAFGFLVNVAAIAEKRCNSTRPWEVIRSSPSADQLLQAAVSLRHDLILKANIPGQIWDTILRPGPRLDIQIFPAFSLNAFAEIPSESLDECHYAFVPEDSKSLEERPGLEGWLMWASPVPGPDASAPHRFSEWCSRITSNAIFYLATSVGHMGTPPDAIDGDVLEKYILRNVLKFCAGYKGIGISGPAIVSVSLSGVLNKELTRSRPSEAKGFIQPFVVLPDLRVSDIASVTDEDLRPLTDKLWRAAGWRGGVR
jgi:hypothetical protein